jgi:hypothetical protein
MNIEWNLTERVQIDIIRGCSPLNIHNYIYTKRKFKEENCHTLSIFCKNIHLGQVLLVFSFIINYYQGSM